MDTLSSALESAMSGYAGQDLNGYSYLTRSVDGQVFTIISIGTLGEQHFAATTLVARVVNDRIVIEHDVNDKPLVNALVSAGIPRQQIVLAYAGESLGDYDTCRQTFYDVGHSTMASSKVPTTFMSTSSRSHAAAKRVRAA